MVSWQGLFDRAAEYEVSLADVRGALADQRQAGRDETGDRDDTAGGGGPPDTGGTAEPGADTEAETLTETVDADRPDPARVVADADVLAADLVLGGPSREALDSIRRHSWVELVATPVLLDDAEAVLGRLADDRLAGDWRERVEETCVLVAQEPGDHPALAAAHGGAAAHLLSFDEGLGSARVGASIRKYVDTSVKRPEAFVRLFDPEALYPAGRGGEYPGPDCDPRA